MKTTHTPGPWQVYTAITDNGKIVYVGTKHKGISHAVIADMPMGQGREANASLIAAAPDMLEALSALVAGGTWKADDNAPLCLSVTPEKITKAKAAIAKATGGSHD